MSMEQWVRPTTWRQHAHLDCFSGAAGDMMFAACLDSVEDLEHRELLLRHIVTCLENGLGDIKGEFEIVMTKVWRSKMGSIAGTHLHVKSIYHHQVLPVPRPAQTESGLSSSSHEVNHAASHSALVNGDSNHNHSHGHAHSHSHSHENEHAHAHAYDTLNQQDTSSSGPIRNLPEIRDMLERASVEWIPLWVKGVAIDAFTRLAQAEAMTHGASSFDQVHFHEVGAVDSIVDTVGTLLALWNLGIGSFSCSRLPMGEGSVWTQHGVLPVPAPATLRLLKDLPIGPGPPGVTGELVTPTAAALLQALLALPENPRIRLPGRPPNMTSRNVGIGCGTKDFEKHPNILRLIIGDTLIDDAPSSTTQSLQS